MELQLGASKVTHLFWFMAFWDPQLDVPLGRDQKRIQTARCVLSVGYLLRLLASVRIVSAAISL